MFKTVNPVYDSARRCSGDCALESTKRIHLSGLATAG
jgi:hypothetical protein